MKPAFSYVHPEVSKLYHYTTIDSLALILKHKTLRLNPLDRMDDLQEAQSAELQNYGQFVFVSSWTDEAQESIPMWKMYASMDSGVRIALPPDPFQIIGAPEGCFRDPTLEEWNDSQREHTAEYPTLDLINLIKNHAIVPNAGLGTQLIKVKYTNDEKMLRPKLERFRKDKAEISVKKMGQYKSMDWKFQREFRYRMFAFPMKISFSAEQDGISQLMDSLRAGTAARPCKCIDLHLANNMLEKMEIVTSPSMSESNKIIVNSLVQSYCPKAHVMASALEGKVR